jgi:hypothetical protein
VIVVVSFRPFPSGLKLLGAILDSVTENAYAGRMKIVCTRRRNVRRPIEIKRAFIVRYLP